MGMQKLVTSGELSTQDLTSMALKLSCIPCCFHMWRKLYAGGILVFGERDVPDSSGFTNQHAIVIVLTVWEYQQ